MYEKKFYSEAINKENVLSLIESFKELELGQHYDFESSIESTITNSDSAIEVLSASRRLTFRFDEDNTLYYVLDDKEHEVVFDVDVSSSFSKSDVWLSDKLIDVTSIFPNVCSAELSSEQTNFYICLVIASIFRDEYEIDFLETVSTYDFKKWSPESDGGKSFNDLNTEWIQINSKYIMMVAAGAKYMLVREKKKKQLPSALQLPEEKGFALNKVMRDVESIRFDYDNNLLSPSNREKMTKLEVKVLISQRDKAIEDCLKKNSEIYQIYRLSRLNSNVIPPTILLKFNRESRKKAVELWQQITGNEETPSSIDDKIEVKTVENKLKRELKRAYLNKMFSKEIVKYMNSPETYVAPDFV